ncbi:MAG TPA: response regulator, partial [Euryarchaeota archaeon]|nr:response regulator [Euryarchaeota archaeon]
LVKINLKQPSLILLDIIMPGLSGWEVCRRIKKDEAHSEIPGFNAISSQRL